MARHENGERGGAVVIGVGAGLGAALCRALTQAGWRVAGVGRSFGPDSPLARTLAEELPGFRAIRADATDAAALKVAAAEAEAAVGPADVLCFNAAAFAMGPFEETAAEDFEAVWRANCLSAFNAAQALLPGMARRGRGAATFTGATASLRGGADFSAFASSKFALRGLVQSLARTYGPQGVHVAHAVIDGRIAGGDPSTPQISADTKTLDPADIAAAYLAVIEQPPSAWSFEFDLRPAAEAF